MVEILHHGFEYSNVDFELFECFGEVQNFVDVLDFVDPFGDEFILLVEALDMFQTVLHGFLIDIFVLTFASQTGLESVLDQGMSDLYFFLYVFVDGVVQGGQFDVDLDDVMMG